jgi:hypothetical protein
MPYPTVVMAFFQLWRGQMRTIFSAPSPFIHHRHHRPSPSPQSRSVARGGVDREGGYASAGHWRYREANRGSGSCTGVNGVSLEQQAALIMPVTLVLYLVAIGWLLSEQRPLLAGITSLLISFLPLWWQTTFTDSEANGFGILLVFMLPIPLLLILAGLVLGAIRLIKRRLQP